MTSFLGLTIATSTIVWTWHRPVGGWGGGVNAVVR
jgi:hypothetical protein